MKRMFFPLLVALMFISCGKKTPLTFDAHLEEAATGSKEFVVLKAGLLKPDCMKCHNFLTEKLIAKFIEPGEPDASVMFILVESGTMPKDAPAVSTEKLEFLRAYILSLKTGNPVGRTEEI